MFRIICLELYEVYEVYEVWVREKIKKKVPKS